MDNSDNNVGVSRAYSIFYWFNAVVIIFIFAVLTAGIALLLFPIVIWYKVAIINRTKIFFKTDDKRLIFQKGRWFVKDDDTIPVKAIDNVKLNRSITGKLFGWCDISVETRSENYKIRFVATKEAEKFRDSFLNSV